LRYFFLLLAAAPTLGAASLAEGLLSPNPGVQAAAFANAERQMKQKPHDELHDLIVRVRNLAVHSGPHSPSMEAIRSKLKESSQMDAAAMNLARNTLAASYSMRAFGGDLLEWLGSDARSASEMLIASVKPGCWWGVVHVILAVDPYNPGFARALGGLADDPDINAQRSALSAIYYLRNEGHWTPELKASVERIAARGKDDARTEAEEWLKVDSDETMLARAASPDQGVKRLALIELTKRHRPASPGREKLLFLFAEARKNWDHSLTEPPLTTDEWAEALRSNPDSMDLLLALLDHGDFGGRDFFRALGNGGEPGPDWRLPAFKKAFEIWNTMPTDEQVEGLGTIAFLGRDQDPLRKALGAWFQALDLESRPAAAFGLLLGLSRANIDLCAEASWTPVIQSALGISAGPDACRQAMERMEESRRGRIWPSSTVGQDE
jgi:hypothetical protein